jgi:hypothetical protein
MPKPIKQTTESQPIERNKILALLFKQGNDPGLAGVSDGVSPSAVNKYI